MQVDEGENHQAGDLLAESKAISGDKSMNDDVIETLDEVGRWRARDVSYGTRLTRWAS
jgi:hypothetical protein